MNRSTTHWLRGVGRAMIAVAALGLVGCDFLDPTEVNNPATTDEDLAAAEQPTASLLPGLRAQFARALAPTIPEVVSDNYSIHGTGLNKVYDTPDQISPDIVGGVYTLAQELRALADFVLDDIVPIDTVPPGAAPDNVQEAQYYRGMAFLFLGERFVGAPVEVDGLPIPSDELVQRAVTNFDAALATAPGGAFANRTRAALARAHRVLGNATEAESNALAALADASFAVPQDYDAGSLNNNPYVFIVLRSLKEMQPLPRLDFLDPKYTLRESPIYVHKAEEMRLILAEIEFSRGNWANGREELAQAIELAQSRPTEAFDDDDARLNEDLSERPHDASIEIRADANSPYRQGLVLTRPGVLTTPTVSWTSLDADSIRAIDVADQEDLLHAFYLARQEILFLEGQRMTDLGIRLPMSLGEVDTNPNISLGDFGTLPIVPSYITDDDHDLFTPASPYDANGNLVTTQVTMMVDLNRLLAQNRVSPFGIQ